MLNLSFPLSELEYFLLILMRIASFVFAAPFFSTRGVPNHVKVALLLPTSCITLDRNIFIRNIVRLSRIALWF